jgi:hypothetical protein
MYTGPSLFHISVVRYYPGLRFVTTLYVLGADAFRYYDRHSRVPNVGSWGADLVAQLLACLHDRSSSPKLHWRGSG